MVCITEYTFISFWSRS